MASIPAGRITPGRDADVNEPIPLIDDISVPRPGGTGRPRNRPDSIKADGAYGFKANRKALRAIMDWIRARPDKQSPDTP